MSESTSDYRPTPSLIVCTAVRGGISPHYEASMDRLAARCRDKGIPFEKRRVAEAPIDAARDTLGAAFLAAHKPGGEQPFSHMLMVDAGVGFDPATIEQMLAADEDFTAAGVPLRQSDIERAIAKGSADRAAMFAVEHTRETRETGKIRLVKKGEAHFAEINAIGAALILVKREVLLRMFEAYPEIQSGSAPTSYFLPALFNKEGLTYASVLRRALEEVRVEKDEGRRTEIIGRALYLNPADFERCGEDIAFCRRWRALHTEDKPARIWLLADATIVHEGHGYYEGNYAATELG